MRAVRRLVHYCTVLFAVGVVPRSSGAQLLVVTGEGDSAAIAHAELAYAEGDGPPVTWLSLRVSSGPVAVIAALPKAATAEPGLDAWFAALEKSSSPNVLPPRSALDCVEPPGYAHVTWPRGSGEPASELDLRSADDVATALEDQGLPPLRALPEAEHYAVWSWTRADRERTTRSLRIVGASAPLELTPAGAFPVLVSAVTSEPRQCLGERLNDELSARFLPGPECNYREVLEEWLAAHDTPLLETRSHGVLFEWAIHGNVVSSPPLADSYGRAASRELAVDADECARQLLELRHPDAPSPAACGDARDFELALAAAGPERATLQRWAISAAQGFSPLRLQPGGDPRLPLLNARSVADPGCGEPPPPLVVIDPPGGRSVAGPTTTTGVEETPVVDATTAGDVGCSCSPGHDPYYDDRDSACSSDTSGTSDDGDDACSGDSSSSSSDHDACSGDSSSSSDDGDDTCSGDSSSSSSSSDGCGSDSSSSGDSGCDGGSEDHSYDGDTCSGSAAPHAERGQKLQARTARPRRVKTSLWSLALVALALPIRRRKRRKI